MHWRYYSKTIKITQLPEHYLASVAALYVDCLLPELLSEKNNNNNYYLSYLFLLQFVLYLVTESNEYILHCFMLLKDINVYFSIHLLSDSWQLCSPPCWPRPTAWICITLRGTLGQTALTMSPKFKKSLLTSQYNLSFLKQPYLILFTMLKTWRKTIAQHLKTLHLE